MLWNIYNELVSRFDCYDIVSHYELVSCFGALLGYLYRILFWNHYNELVSLLENMFDFMAASL